MLAQEFNNNLITSLKKRNDIIIEEYDLKYKAGNYKLLKIISKDIKSDDDIMLISAGFHGDEIAGPLTLLNYLNQIIDYANQKNIKLIVYPLVNPSGFETGLRYNIDNEGRNTNFVRYKLKNGKITDEVKNNERFEKWYWSSDDKLKISLPLETALMHNLIKKDPLDQIDAVIDLHQDNITKSKKPGAYHYALRPGVYHYAFENLRLYKNIINKIKKITPILKRVKIEAGQDSPRKTNKNGFIVRHDGTFYDLFSRLGIKHSIAVETLGATPVKEACEINLIWIYGLMDLIKPKNEEIIAKPPVNLPKKIDYQSKIHLIHTSSPVEKKDLKTFDESIKELKKHYKNVEIFNVKKTELDPRYLSASEAERLRKFRQARKKVDWLAPIYGGTGCADILRHLDDNDLAKIRKNRPLINGFSDTTALINFIYFKLRLLTFHYANACGIYVKSNYPLWFDIISGKVNSYFFHEKDYAWLSAPPKRKIDGIAIGGNLSRFLEMLNITNLKIKSWKPYIFFIEDIEIDVEDLHNLIVALDEKGVFKNVRAIVVGKWNEKEIAQDTKKFNLIFGQKNISADKIIKYLLNSVISKRKKQNDPLYILKANNFGHGVNKNPLIIPIGAKTVISPDGKIEFFGPFVK